MKIFCGNVNWSATEEDLKTLFSAYGPVDSVERLYRDDGSPRGIVFVEMLEAENALKAIISLNGKDYKGRSLRVEKAWTRDEFLANRKAGEDGTEDLPDRR